MGKSEARNPDFEVRVRDRLLARGQVVKCATGLGTYMTMADTVDDPVFKGSPNDNE